MKVSFWEVVKEIFADPGRLLLIWFLVLLFHAGLTGVSDDEAYYWVLGRSPSLGYAYHPPAVGWLTAFFGTLGGARPSPFWLRLPAVLSTLTLLGICLRWLLDTGARVKDLPLGFGILLSFAGVYGLSWMMVPDIPLMLGMGFSFLGCWRLCFSPKKFSLNPSLVALGFGSVLLLLSKYSGILGIGSVLLCLVFLAEGNARKKGILVAVVGALLGGLPAVLWNAAHEWSSFAYQFKERHGDFDIRWMRYLRFWVLQWVLAGPLLLPFGFFTLKKAVQNWKGLSPEAREWRFFGFWIGIPFLVFCIQPLFSDFKVHWALVAWWPASLALACYAIRKSLHSAWLAAQLRVGVGLVLAGILACHFPWVGLTIRAFTGPKYDPRWDVTNDFYGWDGLAAVIAKHEGAEKGIPIGAPVLGSRYQTAAQASFALAAAGDERRVTLIPRDLKALEEWPEVMEVSSPGPGWPELHEPVWFVTDNRYTEEPQLSRAKCEVIEEIETKRYQLLAKTVRLWKCIPTKI